MYVACAGRWSDRDSEGEKMYSQPSQAIWSVNPLMLHTGMNCKGNRLTFSFKI